MTVDRKDGTIRNHPEASVTDLPGIYSLSPYTGEEIVSRQFILDEDPDAIIDIIDATNIERNLYLTAQLLELERPMVIALNFMDEVEKRHLQNVTVAQTGCIGMCQYEPIVEILEPGKEKVTYVKMTAEKAARVVTDHLVNGNVVTEYTVGAIAK